MVSSSGKSHWGSRCQSSCVSHGLPLPVVSPGPRKITRQLQPPAHQRQPQHPQQHASLSHFSADWHWASVWNKCSGGSLVSLIQEIGNRTLEFMTQFKPAGKLVKTWDLGTLILRLGDFLEGQDVWKVNCIHYWGAFSFLQHQEWKFLCCCPSSLVPNWPANLPPCNSRKAIFRAVCSMIKTQWRNRSYCDPRRQLCRWWLTHFQLRIQREPVPDSHHTDPCLPV